MFPICSHTSIYRITLIVIYIMKHALRNVSIFLEHAQALVTYRLV